MLGQQPGDRLVGLREDGEICRAAEPQDKSSPCTQASRDGTLEPRTQSLDAYQQAGLWFAGLEGGLSYAIVEAFALTLAIRASVAFPAVAMVLSPEAGVTWGF